jgi:hypothetical protein
MRAHLACSLMICAAAAAGAQGVRINLEAYREPVLMDTLRVNFDVGASPAKVYEATLKAFAAFDIPVGNTVGNAGIIRSERFHRMRAFAGDLLSKSFACGEDPTGPNADSHRIEIAVVAYVAPASSGATDRTQLGLAIVAEGREPAGPYRAPRVCASTGALERKLYNKIQQLSGT